MNSGLLSIFMLGVSAFVLSFLLTPLIRNIAVRRGWVDRPDSKRKKHAIAVPRIGGIPIILAYGASFGILALLGIFAVSTYVWDLSAVLKFLPAAILVFATGLLDDIVGLKPWEKLLGQSMAGACAVLSGIQINMLAYSPLGYFPSFVITVVWLVACSNAFNLIDGLDGLASGLGLLATITTLIAGLIHGDIGLVIATAPLTGALLGFLLFNYSPASIFLGDCGSLWLGFMLGCYAVIWSQKTATLLGLTGPLIALCVPLIDTILSIVRRFLRCQPIFSADHAHIHHRLLDRGLTPRKVVLLLYAAGGMAACFSLVQSTAKSHSICGLSVLLFCAFTFLGIQYLGYQEFGIAFRVLRHSHYLNTVKFQVSLSQYEKALRNAGDPEECWQIVFMAAREYGFGDLSFHMAKTHLQSQPSGNSEPNWALEIPISKTEWVHLACPYSASASGKVGPFVEVLHRVLPSKAAEFSRNEWQVRRRASDSAMPALSNRQRHESAMSG